MSCGYPKSASTDRLTKSELSNYIDQIPVLMYCCGFFSCGTNVMIDNCNNFSALKASVCNSVSTAKGLNKPLPLVTLPQVLDSFKKDFPLVVVQGGNIFKSRVPTVE